MIPVFLSCWFANRSKLLLYVPGAIGNDYILGSFLNASYQLCVAQRTPPPHTNTALRKFLWGINQSLSPRWNTTNLPVFKEDDPKYVPSRHKLILSRLFDLLWLSVFIYVCDKHSPQFLPSYVYEGTQSWNPLQLIANRDEFLLRAHLGFNAVFIPAAALRAGHCVATCVFLAFGDDPANWPPFFGGIGNAYTMRRFYA